MSDEPVEEQQQDTATEQVEPETAAPEQANKNSAEPVVAKLMKQVEDLRHESAQYRTERNTAREQLTAARRQLLTGNERVRHLLDPSAIGDVLDGVDVDAMFSEDGNLDERALEQALKDAVKARPYYANKSLSDGSRAMKSALANQAPHVRAPKPDPLAEALLRR